MVRRQAEVELPLAVPDQDFLRSTSTEPTGGAWPTAWLHLHIAPLYRAAGTTRFVAAGELGSGIFFNPVDPADAAARLREA